MKEVTEFTAPPQQGFEKFSDGSIYRAVEGEDYGKRRVFLANLTRFAQRNDYELERIVGDGWVEFRFSPIENVESAPKPVVDPGEAPDF